MLGVIVADDLRREIDALFSAFLPADLASRFSTLLAMKPQRWRKIDPWRTWDLLPDACISEWSGPVEDLLRSPLFGSNAAQAAVVLRCGHDKPSLQRQSLTFALTGPSPLLEGFVSVHPGKLGLAINHDGKACVLKR